jgi:hypothetical protein
MDPNPLRTLQTTVRLAKQDRVNKRGVGADIPRTALTFTHGTLIGAYPEAHDDLLFYATAVSAIALSDADHVAFISEHYVELVDTRDHDSPGACDLQGRFASGDPTVKEAVAITLVPRHGVPVVQWEVYHYDGKRVAWEKRIRPHPALGRRLAQQGTLVASEGFRQQADRPGPALLTAGAELVHVGAEEYEHGLTVAFAVAQPCPCGSHKPMYRCCARNN